MNLFRKLDSTEELLCCAISGDTAWQKSALLVLWKKIGDHVAWTTAQRNGVESIVAGPLQRLLPDAGLSQQWGGAAKAMEDQISAYLSELDRVATAFATEGILLVALKNSGIARGIFLEPAGCPMGDVDVLVRPGDFRCANALLMRLGYKLGSRSPLEVNGLVEAERNGGAEYTVTLPNGGTLWFELQWRPIAGRWIQPDQEPKADDLLARSVPIPGSAVRLLSPGDNLLQVCLHTAKHSYVRAPGFRLHTDVDRIVRRCPLDWGLFLQRVEQTQVRTAVYFSLEIPHQLLHTPIPDWVLRQLQPAAWKEYVVLSWLRRVGLFNPNQRKWSKLGYIFFNLLLYDNWRGILRAVFPSGRWMQQRYGFASRWQLPLWYLRRAVDLLLKRANT